MTLILTPQPCSANRQCNSSQFQSCLCLLFCLCHVLSLQRQLLNFISFGINSTEMHASQGVWLWVLLVLFSFSLNTKNQFHHPHPHRSQGFPATYTVNDIDANTTLLKPSIFTVAAVLKFTRMRINFLFD